MGQTSNRKEYESRHKLWIRYLDGNTRNFYTNRLQDTNPDKFKDFMFRIVHKKIQKIGLIQHYLDGQMIRAYLSELGKWISPEEFAERMEKKRNTRYAKRNHDLPNSGTQPKATAPDQQPQKDHRKNEPDDGAQRPAQSGSHQNLDSSVHQKGREAIGPDDSRRPANGQ